MTDYEKEMDPVIAQLREGNTGYEILDGEGPYPERIGAVQEDGTAVYAHRVTDADDQATYEVTMFARTSPTAPAPSAPFAGMGEAHASVIDDVVGSVKHLLRDDASEEPAGDSVVRPVGRTAIEVTRPYDEDDPEAFFDQVVSGARDVQNES